MGTKHPRHDDPIQSESASQPTCNHPSKRRRINDFATPTNKSTSVNHLKSKIRDLTRALEHSDNLPAGVRIEKERALAGYKQDVENINKHKRKNELIKRYHMDNSALTTTMYEERQKATRSHKKVRKRLDAAAPDTAEYEQLEQRVHDAEIDVNYTIYHPLTEKYQSLFPRQEDAAAGKTAARKLVTEKPAMWKTVEQCTADGTLEALRDGKLATSTSTGKRKPAQETVSEGKKGRAGSKISKSAASEEQDGESDGGFFEE